MSKQIVTALFLTAAVSGVLRGQATPAIPNANAPEIMTSGRGDTAIAPTSAVISVSVTTRARTAGQAGADNALRLESTLRALRGLGLAAADLTTIGYSVGPNYEESRDRGRTPAGFIARNTIRAEVRRIEDLGRAIDAALAAGATEISGVQFLSANAESARRAALAEAVGEARANADAIARAAGGRLGRLIAITSGVSSPIYRDGFLDQVVVTGATERGVPTPISPRDLSIAAQVTARWEFVAGR